jgi:hypothetical protein
MFVNSTELLVGGPTEALISVSLGLEIIATVEVEATEQFEAA